MKPAPFRYAAPATLNEALAILAENPEAKPIAGGQSLVPMLNFRLLEPAMLVDLNRIAELDHVTATAAGLTIGALTRHRTVLAHPEIARHVPILAAAMAHVAHFGVRNRGTFGGSLAHADPAAEIPLVVTLLDATLELASVRGTRQVEATDFFVGPLATVLAPDELIVAVHLPAAREGWFEEFARRSGDYALCAIAAVLERRDGRCSAARIALGGVGPTPLRARAAEAALVGSNIDARTTEAAARAAASDAQPESDLHASADFRRHLVEKLAARVLARAWERA